MRTYRLFFLILPLFSNVWPADIQYGISTIAPDNLINSRISPDNFELEGTTKQSIQQVADNSIDENEYYVGGGDRFLISFIDRPSLTYQGTVDQNGNLYIPNLGLFTFGKITLNEAKERIREGIKVKTKDTDAYISLLNTKQANVYIRGVVSEPGKHILSGSMRLFDAIKSANQLQIPSINDCDLRNVTVKNNDSVYIYDLLKYILTDDLNENPYIYPGDHISLELATSKVHISGAVKSIAAGAIPIKEGETVESFISLFRLDASADSGKVILQTGENGIRKTLNLHLPEDSEVQLKDRDLVIIPSKENYTEIATVIVSGEVVRPGAYPISKRVSSVKEILNSAGGNSQFGDLSRAVVIRRGKFIPKELTLTPNSYDSKINAIRPEMSFSMSMMSLVNDFAIIPINDADISLEPGDEIFVPRIETFVYVSGSVKKPGGYEYKSGKPIKYYIKQAGGFGKKADKANVYVVTRYSDILQTTDGKTIHEGNIIVVPISQQNKMLSTVVLPIIQAAVTTVSMFLAIYATFLKE